MSRIIEILMEIKPSAAPLRAGANGGFRKLGCELITMGTGRKVPPILRVRMRPGKHVAFSIPFPVWLLGPVGCLSINRPNHNRLTHVQLYGMGGNNGKA